VLPEKFLPVQLISTNTPCRAKRRKKAVLRRHFPSFVHFNIFISLYQLYIHFRELKQPSLAEHHRFRFSRTLEE